MSIKRWLYIVLGFGGLFLTYLFIAMRNFYQQNYFKTLVKFDNEREYGPHLDCKRVGNYIIMDLYWHEEEGFQGQGQV